jgi:hypothetical protein
MHRIDPDSLPVTTGQVERFTLNPHGELDGLLLAEGKLVHFPPHLSEAVAAAVCLGDKISVHGVRPRGADLIAAVSLITASGETIVDQGPRAQERRREKPKQVAMEVSGTVRLSLYGPKGESRGALLDDGTVLRLPAHEAQRVRQCLEPAAVIEAGGEGIETEHGRAIELREIGPSGGKGIAIGKGQKQKKPHDHKHELGEHGPHDKAEREHDAHID